MSLNPQERRYATKARKYVIFDAGVFVYRLKINAFVGIVERMSKEVKNRAAKFDPLSPRIADLFSEECRPSMVPPFRKRMFPTEKDFDGAFLWKAFKNMKSEFRNHWLPHMTDEEESGFELVRKHVWAFRINKKLRSTNSKENDASKRRPEVDWENAPEKTQYNLPYEMPTFRAFYSHSIFSGAPAEGEEEEEQKEDDNNEEEEEEAEAEGQVPPLPAAAATLPVRTKTNGDQPTYSSDETKGNSPPCERYDIQIQNAIQAAKRDSIAREAGPGFETKKRKVNDFDNEQIEGEEVDDEEDVKLHAVGLLPSSRNNGIAANRMTVGKLAASTVIDLCNDLKENKQEDGDLNGSRTAQLQALATAAQADAMQNKNRLEFLEMAKKNNYPGFDDLMLQCALALFPGHTPPSRAATVERSTSAATTTGTTATVPQKRTTAHCYHHQNESNERDDPL